MKASELKAGEIGRDELGRPVQVVDGKAVVLAAGIHWHDWELEVERLVPESELEERGEDGLDNAWLRRMVDERDAILNECLGLITDPDKREGCLYMHLPEKIGDRIAELEQQVAELTEQNVWLCEQYSGVIDTFTESLSKPTYPAELVIEHMQKWFDKKTEEDIAEAFEEFGGVEAVRKLADENAELTAKLEAAEAEKARMRSGEAFVGEEVGVDDLYEGEIHWIDSPKRCGRVYLTQTFGLAHKPSKRYRYTGPTTAPLTEPAEPEPPAKPDCLKGVPSVWCEWTWCHGLEVSHCWISGVISPAGLALGINSLGEAGLHNVGSLTPIHHDPGAEELREQIEAARGGDA